MRAQQLLKSILLNILKIMLITNFSSLPHLGPQEVVKRGQLRMEKWDMRSADAWSVVLSFLRNTQRWLESYNYCKSVVVRISEIYTTESNHIGCQVMNSFAFLSLFNIVLSPKCSDITKVNTQEQGSTGNPHKQNSCAMIPSTMRLQFPA